MKCPACGSDRTHVEGRWVSNANLSVAVGHCYKCGRDWLPQTVERARKQKRAFAASRRALTRCEDALAECAKNPVWVVAYGHVVIDTTANALVKGARTQMLKAEGRAE